MTIDEAIKHCEEVIDSCNDSCKTDHEQLREWLLELKNYREKYNKNSEHLITMNCYAAITTDISFEDVEKFCEENNKLKDEPIGDALKIITVNRLIEKIKNGGVNFNLV